MTMVAVPWAAIVLFLTLTGGLGLPLGVPPAPEDPVMARVAPDECLFYATWSGTAAPDAASSNETERLLAEPEIGEFFEHLGTQLVAAGRQQAAREGPEVEAVLEDIVDWLRLGITHSGAVFVSDVQIAPGGPPDVRAGAVVHLGEAADRVQAALEKYQARLPEEARSSVRVAGAEWSQLKLDEDAPVITWGTRDGYLVAGVGEGSLEGILQRMETEPPAWLAALREKLDVGRRSTLTYLNVQAIRDRFAPMAGPEAMAVIQAAGLGNVSALASATGLDETGSVGRTLVAVDGQLTGILGLAGDPLAPGDLAPIPADATVAAAVRFNASEAFDTLVSVVGAAEPRARGEIEQGLAELTQQTGIDLRNDVLRPLGDIWCVYNSPSEGGLVVTGLTAVIQVADPGRIAETQRKLKATIDAMAAAERLRGRRRRGPSIDTFQFAGHEVYVLNVRERGFPVAPSWCLAGKYLVVSLFPQNVKAYLSRGPEFESIEEVPEVAALFAGDAAPFKFLYVDTREIFELAYPVLQMAAQVATAELRREGIDLDITHLPSAAAIAPHLKPTVLAVRRSENGLEIVTHQTLPGGNALAAAPFLAFAGTWAVPIRVHGPIGLARGRTQSMNNMRQIALALHNYHAVHGAFPPAYTTDEQGNPLLSWRVLILPYVGQGPLYKQFHLDEPWDSPHNKALIPLMPEVYRSPRGSRQPGMTNYLGVGGEKGIFPGKDGVRIRDIHDGTPNTLMTVEVNNEEAVIWTKPGDYQPDPENPTQGLGGLWPGGFLAGFADGSVHFLRSSIDPDVLMRLFQRNDGRPVPYDVIRGAR